MALPWPLTVLVTALLALLCSMCIYTEFEFTLKVPVKTTAENAFRFLSNPMVIKDLHPLVVSMKIKSQHPIPDLPGEYFDLAVVGTIPVLGHHSLRNQVWTNTEALTIKNMAQPLWGLITANVTWTMVSDGAPVTGRCYLEEQAVTSLPWLLSVQIKSIEEEAHLVLLKKAQQAIEELNTTPEKKPASIHEHSDL